MCRVNIHKGTQLHILTVQVPLVGLLYDLLTVGKLTSRFDLQGGAPDINLQGNIANVFVFTLIFCPIQVNKKGEL